MYLGQQVVRRGGRKIASKRRRGGWYGDDRPNASRLIRRPMDSYNFVRTVYWRGLVWILCSMGVIKDTQKDNLSEYADMKVMEGMMGRFP